MRHENKRGLNIYPDGYEDPILVVSDHPEAWDPEHRQGNPMDEDDEGDESHGSKSLSIFPLGPGYIIKMYLAVI